MNVQKKSYGLLMILLVAVCIQSEARATTPCMDEDNKCNPDKLCTFKAEYMAKQFTYDTYAANNKKGPLYKESIQEAKAQFPSLPKDEQLVKAGQIFQEKIAHYVVAHFKLPQCRMDGKLNRTLLPKAGYNGMNTNEHCQARVNYDSGDYDPNGFGASHTTCKEFYERDRAHEQIHQNFCEAAAKNGTSAARFQIDSIVAEELTAYKHSARLAEAYTKLLSIRCSAKAKPQTIKDRMKKIQDLLAPYQAGKGGK